VRKPKLIQAGTVPCVTCRKPHNYYKTGERSASWADPVDGHYYVRMSAEQVVAYLAQPWVPA